MTIEAFAGRSLDAKRALYREIAGGLQEAGIPKQDVFIVLKEIPMENWGLRGGVAGCDIDFGFLTFASDQRWSTRGAARRGRRARR